MRHRPVHPMLKSCLSLSTLKAGLLAVPRPLDPLSHPQPVADGQKAAPSKSRLRSLTSPRYNPARTPVITNLQKPTVACPPEDAHPRPGDLAFEPAGCNAAGEAQQGQLPFGRSGFRLFDYYGLGSRFWFRVLGLGFRICGRMVGEVMPSRPRAAGQLVGMCFYCLVEQDSRSAAVGLQQPSRLPAPNSKIASTRHHTRMVRRCPRF